MKYVQIEKTGQVVAVETDSDDEARRTVVEWLLGRTPKNGQEAYGSTCSYSMTVLTPSTGIQSRRL